MDKSLSRKARKKVLATLRRHHQSAGIEYKAKLLNQAQDLSGYHRKEVVRALRAAKMIAMPWMIPSRPVEDEPEALQPWLRRIWEFV